MKSEQNEIDADGNPMTPEEIAQREAKRKAEAFQLIDDFAAKLLALNDGNKIPTDWNIRLKMALTPKPKKAGRKRDYGQVANVVKQLTLAAGKVRKSRTKHCNPAIAKDEIATANNIDRKTVERIDAALPVYMSELERLDPLNPELRKAYINGIADALCERLRENDAIEDALRRQELRRQLNRLLSPPEE